MKIEGTAKNINNIRYIVKNCSCNDSLLDKTIPSKKIMEQIFIIECKIMQLMIFPLVFSYNQDVIIEKVKTSAR